MLPPSPGLSGGARTLDARTAVWAGSRLLVWNFLRATPRALLDETGAADRPETRPDRIDLWAYDPATGRWLPLPDEPDGRAGPPGASGDAARALLRCATRPPAPSGCGC